MTIIFGKNSNSSHCGWLIGWLVVLCCVVQEIDSVVLVGVDLNNKLWSFLSSLLMLDVDVVVLFLQQEKKKRKTQLEQQFNSIICTSGGSREGYPPRTSRKENPLLSTT